MEMVKFWQGSFMDYDMDMYDDDQNYNCHANSTNINEELGQVEYIFSDKTGTLTCNIMEFKKFSTKASAFHVNNPNEDEEAAKANEPIDFNSNPNGLVTKNEKECKKMLYDHYY